jgi:hypothetical protein
MRVIIFTKHQSPYQIGDGASFDDVTADVYVKAGVAYYRDGATSKTKDEAESATPQARARKVPDEIVEK